MSFLRNSPELVLSQGRPRRIYVHVYTSTSTRLIYHKKKYIYTVWSDNLPKCGSSKCYMSHSIGKYSEIISSWRCQGTTEIVRFGHFCESMRKTVFMRISFDRQHSKSYDWRSAQYNMPKSGRKTPQTDRSLQKYTMDYVKCQI